MDTTKERAISNRVTAAERRLLSGTKIPPDQLLQEQAPWGVCEKHMKDCQMFDFIGWLARTQYVMEGAERSVSRPGRRSGWGAARQGTRPPRWTRHLVDLLLRIPLRYYHATEWDAYQQGQ